MIWSQYISIIVVLVAIIIIVNTLNVRKLDSLEGQVNYSDVKNKTFEILDSTLDKLDLPVISIIIGSILKLTIEESNKDNSCKSNYRKNNPEPDLFINLLIFY